MMLRDLAFLLSLATTVPGLAHGPGPAGGHDHGPELAKSTAKSPAQKPKLENLMKAQLERVKDTEVIVSRVTLGPNTTLPTHWHPGEEFAYVIEGEVTLWQKDKEDQHFKAGEAAKVPLKQVHTAKTGKKGATLLVFRVHELGQPERVMVTK